MATDTHFAHHPPSPEEARAALAEADRVQASTAALSATPWPTWFAAVLTGYLAALPFLFGGVSAGEDWPFDEPVRGLLLLVVSGAYLVLFAVAARSWRRRTGVALRFDVLPKKATLPLMAGLPVVLVGSVAAFRASGHVGWLLAGSVLGALISVGFHLAFVRLHRKAS
ncbi:hypothetical protein ACFQVC_05635 [Streptomyces monticola]|uniref:Uncharacterized protein n=1 Tax=Streptomyces monticola TaxID=2666263 RepID=A0ABW2JDK4_9ACTN